MAKSTAANASLLLLLFLAILSASFISTSGSRIIHTPPKNLKRSNVLILRDLGLDPSAYYRRRSLLANSDRAAPGGPDPQHHNLPPF
ncbi:hypothetical protein RHGRI_010182 [Rhododendron griersonianum]|uniref:Uncharacterized protein n=1 Tax=Rhododendron griersonianum TaxID=479676 RepID=A0AAV6KHK1_9ERIC|nr:hypothetical protein RHGRI_010182 [Rhododendron griersonianum]